MENPMAGMKSQKIGWNQSQINHTKNRMKSQKIGWSKSGKSLNSPFFIPWFFSNCPHPRLLARLLAPGSTPPAPPSGRHSSRWPRWSPFQCGKSWSFHQKIQGLLWGIERIELGNVEVYQWPIFDLGKFTEGKLLGGDHGENAVFFLFNGTWARSSKIPRETGW